MHAHTHSLQWGEEEEEERWYIHRTNCALFERRRQKKFREKRQRESWTTQASCDWPTLNIICDADHQLMKILFHHNTSWMRSWHQSLSRSQDGRESQELRVTLHSAETHLMSASLERSDYSTVCISATSDLYFCLHISNDYSVSDSVCAPLTKQRGRTRPISLHTRPGDAAPGWTSPWSGTQSCPWWRPQTDSASGTRTRSTNS